LRGNLDEVGKGLTAATGFGLFVGICVAQTQSLFSADAWNNITFTAGEVKNPRRNIPLSLAFGTFLVIGLY
jgi:APA family basic amino acid/polyamine antiporter